MDTDDRQPDDKLDEALDETFPASDSPANTVVTGARIEPAPSAISEPAVRDDRAACRFEVVEGGQVAFLQYERRAGALVLLHTEVPEALRGRGIASLLAKTGLASAQAEGLPVVVRCPFVRGYLRKRRAAIQRRSASPESAPAGPPDDHGR